MLGCAIADARGVLRGVGDLIGSERQVGGLVMICDRVIKSIDWDQLDRQVFALSEADFESVE